MTLTPTPFHSVDEQGYVFISRSACCAIRTTMQVVERQSALIGPTPIPEHVGSISQNLADRLRIYVRNSASAAAASPNRQVFLGGPSVTPETGFPLDPGREIIFELADSIQLYVTKEVDAIGGTITVHTIELS